MTRILHTIETRGPGGAEILLVNIAKGLEAKGFDNFGFFIKEGWLQEQFREFGYAFRYEKLARPLDIFFCCKLLKFVRNEKIRVIHAHEFTMAFYACVISLFIPKLKVVCTFHGRHYHSDTPVRQKVMRFVAKHSKVVAVSGDVRNYIASCCNIDKHQIMVIENGVRLPPANLTGRIRDELGLQEKITLIGSVGRLHKIKGHVYLIEAAEQILQHRQDVHFIIAGEGAERKILEKLISEKEMGEHFTLLGNRTDIDNILSSLDIFVLPSLSEGTSLALLEAMGHSLPIVATRVGNNSKIISSGNGVLVNPKEVQELADGILFIKSLLENGSHFTINRKLIEHNFSFSSMMLGYLKIYDGV